MEVRLAGVRVGPGVDLQFQTAHLRRPALVGAEPTGVQNAVVEGPSDVVLERQGDPSVLGSREVGGRASPALQAET